MFSRGFGDLVQDERHLPSAAPAFVLAFVLCVAVTGVVFWLYGSTMPLMPLGWSSSERDAMTFIASSAMLAMLLSAMLWSVAWFGLGKRTGRDVGLHLIAFVVGVNAVVAASAIYVRYRMDEGLRSVAAIERGWTAGLSQDNREFVGAFRALRLRQAIEPSKIAKDKDLSEAKAHLRRGHEIVEQYRSRFSSRVAATRRKLQAAPVPEETRKRLLAAFEAQRLEADPEMLEFYDRHDNALYEVEAAVALLHRSRGTWTVEGRRVYFRDLSVFRRMKAYAQGIDDNVEALDRQIMNSRSQALFGTPHPLPAVHERKRPVSWT